MSVAHRETHMKKVMNANMHGTDVADSDDQYMEHDSDADNLTHCNSLLAPPNIPHEF